jgi:hypothetical protein
MHPEDREADYMRRDSGAPVETGGPTVFYGFDPVKDAEAAAARQAAEKYAAVLDTRGFEATKAAIDTALAANQPIRTIGQPYQRPLTHEERLEALRNISYTTGTPQPLDAPAFPWWAVGVGAAILAVAIYRGSK